MNFDYRVIEHKFLNIGVKFNDAGVVSLIYGCHRPTENQLRAFKDLGLYYMYYVRKDTWPGIDKVLDIIKSSSVEKFRPFEYEVSTADDLNVSIITVRPVEIFRDAKGNIINRLMVETDFSFVLVDEIPTYESIEEYLIDNIMVTQACITRTDFVKPDGLTGLGARRMSCIQALTRYILKYCSGVSRAYAQDRFVKLGVYNRGKWVKSPILEGDNWDLGRGTWELKPLCSNATDFSAWMEGEDIETCFMEELRRFYYELYKTEGDGNRLYFSNLLMAFR